MLIPIYYTFFQINNSCLNFMDSLVVEVFMRACMPVIISYVAWFHS